MTRRERPFVPFDPADVEQSIPSRFEQQVRARPDHPAVKARDYTLTYAGLNEAANRIARAILAERGEGEEAIALVLEPDRSIVPAIMGVLKAGKIYVSLDPSLPAPRSISLLDDAGVRLIVTSNAYAAATGALVGPGRAVLDVDALDAGLSAENLARPLPPDTLASIYYTSGSTGRPKGALQSHRNILHATMDYTNELHLCRGDRLALLHSYSFAASLGTLFGALLTGATLYPFSLPEEGLTRLAPWLIAEGITVCYTGPSVFRHFVGTLSGREAFPAMRLVRLVGEPVTSKDVELFRAHFPETCLLVNALGSAEALMFRQHLIDRDTPIGDGIVPVGQACDGLEVLLLDEDGAEVAPGSAGEIVVRSRYLSPGYWRQPLLTAAAFEPDPREAGVRRYRTGDVGRMLPGRTLLHLGRKDWQVKVRGHKVELGEVERTLLDHPAVKETVVVAREDEPGETRLVAYVVARAAPPPSSAVLRRFLAEKLPGYMVPGAFIAIEALPLTANNKVDRQALPRPSRARPDLPSAFAGPRGPVESALAGIWAEVLDLDEVGVDDNFLDLGGDSLRATRIVTRVVEVFDVELLSRSLFDAPTVADMAVVIAAHLAAARGIAVTDLLTEGPDGSPGA